MALGLGNVRMYTRLPLHGVIGLTTPLPSTVHGCVIARMHNQASIVTKTEVLAPPS